MTTGDPKRIGVLLRKIYELVGDNVLPVPEHTVYPLAEAATAVRTISAAEHTGKLILSIPRVGHSTVVVPPEQARVFRSESLSGLAEWLAGVAANDSIHKATPRAAIEGS